MDDDKLIENVTRIEAKAAGCAYDQCGNPDCKCRRVARAALAVIRSAVIEKCARKVMADQYPSYGDKQRISEAIRDLAAPRVEQEKTP